VIVALVIFLVIKALNSLKKKEAAVPPPPPPGPTNEEILLTEIRNILAKK
jgi:large conductance mechanosensitive channel